MPYQGNFSVIYGDHYGQLKLIKIQNCGIPSPAENLIAQFLYLWLRDYYCRKLSKDLEICCGIVSSRNVREATLMKTHPHFQLHMTEQGKTKRCVDVEV